MNVKMKSVREHKHTETFLICYNEVVCLAFLL